LYNDRSGRLVTTIYRVENADDNGPYVPSDVTLRNGFDRNRHNNDDTHPGYFQDKILLYTVDNIRRYHFGFSNKRQLRTWFNIKERKLLSDIGYTINKYMVEAKHVVKSERQAVFLREHATFVEHYEVSEF